KAAGLQLYADANLSHSILLSNNLLLGAYGQIAPANSVEVFTGTLLGKRDRGKNLGFGIALPYGQAEPAVQGASDAIMLGRNTTNFLNQAEFPQALTAGNTAAAHVDQYVDDLRNAHADPTAIADAKAAQHWWQLALPLL